MGNLEMAFGNMLLLIFVVIEVLILKYVLRKSLPWKELIMNLNSGHILMWIFRGIEVTGYYYTSQYLSLHVIDPLPEWITWIFAFILWDFMFYWLHYTHHKIAWLWKIHVVHHEGEHYSLSLGIRNSWYSSLTSFPYFVVMALAGFSTQVFITVSSIHYFIQFYNHNHLIKNSGWLDYLMVTPKHHRVHHGKNAPYVDKNFGGTLVIWDKLFGTFEEEKQDNPVKYGIDKPVQSNNPILVNNVPFLKTLKSFEIKNQESSIKLSNFLMLSGSLILFLELLLFIYLEDLMPVKQKTLFFLMVFFGTIGLGLILDGKRWSLPVWTIFRLGFPLYLFLVGFENLWIYSALLAISSIHGIAIILASFHQLFAHRHESLDIH